MPASEIAVDQIFARRFKIEKLLGRGGMAAVYLGRHIVLERPFAIKVIHENLLSDQELVARFRREARVISRLDNPHITSIFDFGHTEDGRPYLVLEYVEGMPLSDALADGPFEIKRALATLRQLAVALASAHGNGVIHRDLKPQNIILVADGGETDFVKVLDFGLARLVDVENTLLTQMGRTVGTPAYMAPEQISEAGVHPSADVYSFGVIAFEMFVGQPPFVGENIVEVANGHLYSPVPRPTIHRPDLPPCLENTILSCLAKAPTDRYTNGSALVSAIDGCIANLSPPEASLGTGPDLPHIGADYDDDTTCADDRTVIDPGEERTRALEDLAAAVRDRGFGQSEISQMLAEKVRAEDGIIEIEVTIGLLELEMVERKNAARKRETPLYRALSMLEQEHREVVARFESTGKTLPLGLDQRLATLDRDIATTAKKMKRITEGLKEETAALEDQLDNARRALEKSRETATTADTKLVVLLQGTRERVAKEAPELHHLFLLAGIRPLPSRTT